MSEEIAKNMKEFEGENNIEFTRNSHTATVYFSQGKYISKIHRLKERYPDEVEIVKINPDGTIVAHIPTKWIKISAAKRIVTDEQKEEARRRLKAYHKDQNKKVKGK